MTSKITEDTKETIAMISRLVTPVGVVLLLLLQTQFASKEEVDNLKIQVNKLETAITLLIEQNKHNARQDERIARNTDSIRTLEVDLAKLNQ